MNISNLIDQGYTTTSILEDTRDVLEWLRKIKYLAVVDENQITLGIITIKDLQGHPEGRNVSDLLFEKPKIDPEQTVIEVYQIMKETDNDCLPVYDNENFLGVITIMKITEGLIQIFFATKKNIQQGIGDIHISMANIERLTSLFNGSITVKNSQELVKLVNICCDKVKNLTELMLTLGNTKP